MLEAHQWIERDNRFEWLDSGLGRCGKQIEVAGERKNISEWAKFLGVSRQRAQQLFKKGELISKIQTKMDTELFTKIK